MSSNITLSKKDIVWSYFAQFFSIASGIITLPLILRMLSSEEIGMNYLMLTIGSLVSLFDFGFAPQFGRNITYIFSGVQELKKEGIDFIGEKQDINYRLLTTMIHTAKSVYRIIGFIVLATMLSFGTLYIYNVTQGFTNIHNSFIIWMIYSFSTFLNIYYSYYTSLLTGKGLIMESRKAMVYSRLIYIVLTFLFLFLDFGLLGVVLANLLAPFVNRYVSYYYFFTPEIKEMIKQYIITKKEKIDLFNIIWYNAKKLGIVFLGSYAINKLGMFLAGLFLSLNEIATYGLMLQLVGIISVISTTLFNAYQPKFASLRVQNDNNQLIRLFSYSMMVFFILYILCGLGLVIVAPWALSFIKSNAVLPSTGILVLYIIITLLENNHSSFATLITTQNNIPFVFPSLFAGGLIALGSFISLKFTTLGVLGLVIVQGISQLIYNNWKWPMVIFKEFGISFSGFFYMGLIETKTKFNKLIYGRS